MADHHVITIARSFGSGGRTMGKMLAQELGWSYYDRELLRLASDESGISENFFARADESFRRTPLFRIASNVFDGQVIPPDKDDFISNENLFRYQAKIIRSLAATENCVIVGRCANYILRDQPHVAKLYIHAPHDVCVRSVMQTFGMTSDEAVKAIRDTDKRRAEYYRYFTGHDWKDADYYDLCLDSSQLGREKCVALVKAYLSEL
mgnify:CR=1 FL=1